MLSWSVPPGMAFPAALLISLEVDNMINQCVLIVRRGEGRRGEERGGEGRRGEERGGEEGGGRREGVTCLALRWRRVPPLGESICSR